MSRSVLPIALFLLAFAAECCAGSVRLRTAAAADPMVAVRLGDVATLEGPDALGHAGVVLIEDAAKSASGRGWTTVTLADVRAALERAGARMSRLTLSGATCTVRLQISPEEVQPVAPSPEEAPKSIDLSGVPTVRKHAARALASYLDVESEHLRVQFDASDQEFLDEPRVGRRVIVSPAATPNSRRIVLNARVFEEDRLVDSRTLRADVETRRNVLVLRDACRRGREFSAEAIDEQLTWLPVGGGRPLARLEEAVGSLARTRLDAGTILREEHLESPVIIRRNELVTIHAVQSGFEVRTRARAREEGRRGDVIEFRLEGAQKTFRARVESAGIAVIDLDGATPIVGGMDP